MVFFRKLNQLYGKHRKAEISEMESTKRIRSAVSAALAAVLCLGGCSKAKPAEETELTAETVQKTAEPEMEYTDASGTYLCIGRYVEPDVVQDKVLLSYELTLETDGTGYMFLGNQMEGKINSWVQNQNSIRISSGIGEFEGTFSKGVIILSEENQNGFVPLCFSRQGADLSELKVITEEAFEAELEANGKTVAYDDAEAPGTYSLYAMEQKGITVQVPQEGEAALHSVLVLKEDGSAEMTTEGQKEAMTWTLAEGKLSLTGTDHTGYEMTLKNGIISWTIQSAEGGLTEYFAKEGADVSSLGAITLEEYRGQEN